MLVLVVEDDTLNTKLLVEILEDAGFDTTTAKNGVEAVEIMNKPNDVEIILLDVMMPVMDGFQFMEEFNKHPEWQDRMVIMQTAATHPKDVVTGNTKGTFYYLTKPFTPDTVLSVVRAAVEEKLKRS